MVENGRYNRYRPRDITTTAKPKRQRGRPVGKPLPPAIPDTPENIPRCGNYPSEAALEVPETP